MIRLRQAQAAELAGLSALCLRSKAVHGYGPDLIEAFREELTLTLADLESDVVTVAERDDHVCGVMQVSTGKDGCFLEKLFVDPDHIGSGLGGVLFNAAVLAARVRGASEMIIESDPGAVDFYEAMGAIAAGEAESASVPGRRLPRLVLPL